MSRRSFTILYLDEKVKLVFREERELSYLLLFLLTYLLFSFKSKYYLIFNWSSFYLLLLRQRILVFLASSLSSQWVNSSDCIVLRYYLLFHWSQLFSSFYSNFLRSRVDNLFSERYVQRSPVKFFTDTPCPFPHCPNIQFTNVSFVENGLRSNGVLGSFQEQKGFTFFFIESPGPQFFQPSFFSFNTIRQSPTVMLRWHTQR